VTKEEWKANPTAPGVMEDVAKLPFHFTRNWFFQHPRTTMLMFGPKNAPTQQRHYLCVPFQETQDGKFTPENFAKVKLDKFAILIVTQFDGIPMADVFRVLLYQFYETVDGGKCQVRMGLGMHYIKSSMFKSQIISGTKDELVVQLASWVEHMKKNTISGKVAITGAAAQEASQDTVSSPVQITAGHVAPPVGAGGDPLQQIMQNWVILAIIGVVFLILLLHIWSCRSQISHLSSRVEELERSQKQLLLDFVSKMMLRPAN
jgi:hypothetical protein